jgi:hypothetical protein
VPSGELNSSFCRAVGRCSPFEIAVAYSVLVEFHDTYGPPRHALRKRSQSTGSAHLLGWAAGGAQKAKWPRAGERPELANGHQPLIALLLAKSRSDYGTIAETSFE